MSSIGSGFDITCGNFSPDGRIFQIEYAMKAVEASGTAIGIRCKDGVILAVEKLVQTKLHESTSGRRIFNIDEHIGMSAAGLLSDTKHLVDYARAEARDYYDSNGIPIPCKQLASRVSAYVHRKTLGHNRPFGCCVILGSFEPLPGAKEVKPQPQLYMIEPSGVFYGYFGCAIGKAKQAAKTELEKLKLNELTCEEAAKQAAKIIYQVHDEVKDKEFLLEMSWTGLPSAGKHEQLPKQIYEGAVRYALDEMADDEDDD